MSDYEIVKAFEAMSYPNCTHELNLDLSFDYLMGLVLGYLKRKNKLGGKITEFSKEEKEIIEQFIKEKDNENGAYLETYFEQANLVYKIIKKEYNDDGTRKQQTFLQSIFNKKRLLELFWIFFFACILGDLIEVAFVYLTDGTLMSRSSVLYGPFSLTWGGGALILSLIAPYLGKKEDRYTFLLGAIGGGLFEYICSWTSEMNYGFVFWEYSHLPQNLNGRITLLFCIFWGFASVIWVKILYPRIIPFMRKISSKIPAIIAIIIGVLFAINCFISNQALYRYGMRVQNIEAKNSFERWIDEKYPDQLVKDRYKNIHIKYKS